MKQVWQKIISRFTSEFKSKVALEAIKENNTMEKLTQEIGVHSTQIKEWKEELLKGINKVFESGSKSEENTPPRFEPLESKFPFG